MLGLYPADVVRRAEQDLMQRVPEGSLMQIAARGLATRILQFVRDVRGSVAGARVVLLVGAGNNGGDALFAGAYLRRRGMHVHAVMVTKSFHEPGAQALLLAGGAVLSAHEGLDLIRRADVLIDGIVGIGARGALREPAAKVVTRANQADALRVAVDVPSGIGVDDGGVEGIAFDADATVTFGCYKPGLFLHPGRVHAGAVHLVDIGLRQELPDPTMRVLDVLDVAELLSEPEPDDHKYRRGVVGIAAGSPAYPGAAVLTVGAARYSGVGMVRFLDRGDAVAPRVIGSFPDVVADPRDARTDSRVKAWGCGPGFTEVDTQAVEMVLAEPTPIVLDAGALNALAASEGLLRALRTRSERGRTTIVTPHEGEYARLFGAETPSLEAAEDWGVVLVRKGPATTITTPEGTVYVDPMGTPDLAVAGSGDVLTGLMAGLLAARPSEDPSTVAAAAVWLHGLSGRCAAADEQPVTSMDIAAFLPRAIARTRTGDLAGCGL